MSEPRPIDPQALPIARRLATGALVMWSISLLLPSFVVETRTEPAFGYWVLLTGFLFGWMVHGWAAYANLFFLYAVARLNNGKTPTIAAALMLLLGLTVFLFPGVPPNEAGGVILPVVSWGWGAVLWGCAILLVAAATGIHIGWYGRRGVAYVVAGLAAGLFSVGLLHLIQRGFANSQEREVYLSPSMAFATVRFCGVDFVWPESPLVSQADPVVLDIDQDLKSSKRSPYLLLPAFSNFQEGGHHWRIYERPPNLNIKVRSRAEDARYALEVRRISIGALIRLLDRVDNKVIYEQPLRSRRVRHLQNAFEYCPFSTFHWQGLKKGYDTALLRALGQPSPVSQQAREVLKAEAAHTRCDLGYADIDGVKGLREWDGREVMLDPPSVRSRAGFCSSNYIGLVHVMASGVDFLAPIVHLFDRKTLRPIAVFNDRRPCPSPRCDGLPHSLIKGFKLESNEVVRVETENGELTALRI